MILSLCFMRVHDASAAVHFWTALLRAPPVSHNFRRRMIRVPSVSGFLSAVKVLVLGQVDDSSHRLTCDLPLG